MTVRQKQAILIVSLLLAGFAGSFLPGRISVTLTPSVKHRLWWLSTDTSNIRTGEYVLFLLPHSRLSGMPVPETVVSGRDIRAIKRVGCDEGEVLNRKGLEFFCGDQFLGHAKQRSQGGEPLTPFLFCGTIPSGQAFLVGDHPDSFDSRYFGLVDKSRYLAWARPIF
jgi:signal peptidase I/conjugal transfer pilin signal peptidase TrbI